MGHNNPNLSSRWPFKAGITTSSKGSQDFSVFHTYLSNLGQSQSPRQLKDRRERN